MSDKKVKTTDKTPKVNSAPKAKINGSTPKVAVKTKDAISNTTKTVKEISKDTVIKKAVHSNIGTESNQSEPPKADTEAAENVEHASYEVGSTVYNKSKNFTKNRISDIKKRIKTKENEEEQVEENPEEPDNEENELKDKEDTEKDCDSKEDKPKENEPKQKENYEKKDDTTSNKPKDKTNNKPNDKQGEKPKVKTKEEYLKSQKNTNETSDSKGVKTKENYLKKEMNEAKTEPDKSTLNARKEYVSKKLKEKTLDEKINEQRIKTDTDSNHLSKLNTDIKTKENTLKITDVKTKDSYIKSLQTDRSNTIKAHYNNTPKSKVNSVSRMKPKNTLGNKGSSGIKKGKVYNGKLSKSKSFKFGKTAVKTQNEMAKKAAKATKEAAKRAKQAAKRAAKISKKIAVRTAKIIAHITKLIAAAVTKAASAFFAAFGWVGVVVLLVVLIVVIIVAAIAGSPFGIFISDEAADADSIPVSSIVNECNMELSQKLTDIEDTTTHDRIVMEGEQADWSLVLSLFSVKLAGKYDDTAEDVVVIDDAKKQKLKDVFWDIHRLSKRTATVGSGDSAETVLYITITAKTKEQMISEYGFTEKQKEALETLLGNSDGMLASTQSLAISDTTAQEIIDNLPDDLQEERKRVVKKACSLVGKLTYFWGGKSEVIGWDSEWGKMKLVTSEGSRSSGCMRPFGLDCSGFVTWSFINAGYSASAIGHGTSTQVSKGTRISLSSAKPGDLAFYNDQSHVGIVGGKDDSGNILVINCSSGANNVVITTGGFGFAIIPNCY